MITPHYFQQNAIASIYQYFEVKTGNPCVAMPTGTGKSVVIAGFIHKAVVAFPGTRCIVATHVKELVAQNYNTLLKLWPYAPCGICSNGLKREDTFLPIIFGSIGTMVNRVRELGYRDFIIVDEAHLLSPDDDTMYQQFIAGLKIFNPNLKVIGLSATPFRLKQGYITDGGVLTDFCYDITGVEWFNRLIAEGFMCPLYPKRTATELDISNVGLQGGDLNQTQLQKAVDKTEITRRALTEACDWGKNRKSWMTFASGIEHAEHIAEMCNSFGVPTTFVHSKISHKDRDKRIQEFKAGHWRNIVGYKILTTGFDHPPIDMIIDLYPTVSPGMHVQKYGRGTRVSPATQKEDCIVLDYARNTKNLGPINDPRIPGKKGKGNGDMPVRICDVCGTYNHAAARVCACCGTEFGFKPKIIQSAGTDEIIKSNTPQIEYFEVKRTIYAKQQKLDHNKIPVGPPFIKVTYYCGNMGLQSFSECVFLQHDGYAGKASRDWWRRRFPQQGPEKIDPPDTTDQALSLISFLKEPKRIRVHVNKKYPDILDHEF